MNRKVVNLAILLLFYKEKPAWFLTGTVSLCPLDYIGLFIFSVGPFSSKKEFLKGDSDMILILQATSSSVTDKTC